MGEGFEVGVAVLPGGVHDAVDVGEVFGGFEPIFDLGGVVIVVAGDDLVMAAVSEEFEALGAFFEIPGNDGDVFVEAFPGAGEGPANEIIVVVGVVIGIKHVGPGVDATVGIYFAKNFCAGADIIGEDLAGGKFAGLAGAAPIEDADFVVGHHVAFGAPGGVHAFGLVAEEVVRFGFGRADIGLVVVDSHGVVAGGF